MKTYTTIALFLNKWNEMPSNGQSKQIGEIYFL